MRRTDRIIAVALALLLAPEFSPAQCSRSRVWSPPSNHRAAPPEIIRVPQYDEDVAMAECPSQPQSTCQIASGVRLVVRNELDSSKDTLIWRWARGDAFAEADLGEPSRKTKYALCVYDSVDSVRLLSTSIVVEPGRGWRRKDAKGWKYKDARGQSAGVTDLVLRSGDMQKSRVRLEARGRDLPLPPPASGSSFFHKDGSVIVQLAGAGKCWTSTFATAKKNNATGFVGP